MLKKDRISAALRVLEHPVRMPAFTRTGLAGRGDLPVMACRFWTWEQDLGVFFPYIKSFIAGPCKVSSQSSFLRLRCEQLVREIDSRPDGSLRLLRVGQDIEALVSTAYNRLPGSNKVAARV